MQAGRLESSGFAIFMIAVSEEGILELDFIDFCLVGWWPVAKS